MVRVNYICDRCGASIGGLNLDEQELEQLGLDPLTVEISEDIIKNDHTGSLFIYSLCNECVETMSFHESELPYLRAPDYH